MCVCLGVAKAAPFFYLSKGFQTGISTDNACLNRFNPVKIARNIV